MIFFFYLKMYKNPSVQYHQTGAHTTQGEMKRKKEKEIGRKREG